MLQEHVIASLCCCTFVACK